MEKTTRNADRIIEFIMNDEPLYSRLRAAYIVFCKSTRSDLLSDSLKKLAKDGVFAESLAAQEPPALGEYRDTLESEVLVKLKDEIKEWLQYTASNLDEVK